jgi:hypothetical protein
MFFGFAISELARSLSYPPYVLMTADPKSWAALKAHQGLLMNVAYSSSRSNYQTLTLSGLLY